MLIPISRILGILVLFSLGFSLPVAAADYGDAIITASIGDASTLVPILASDSASADICGLVFNGLIRYDKDLNPEGDLAESWDIKEDGLVIIFHLRTIS